MEPSSTPSCTSTPVKSLRLKKHSTTCIVAGMDSQKTFPGVNKQGQVKDTHRGPTTPDKQPHNGSPLSKKPRGSTKEKSTTVTSARKEASTLTPAKKKALTPTKKKALTPAKQKALTPAKKKASTVTSPKKESTLGTSPKKKKAHKPRKKKAKRQSPSPDVQDVDSHSDVPWFLLVDDPVADMRRNMEVIDRDLNKFWLESLEPTSTAAEKIDRIM